MTSNRDSSRGTVFGDRDLYGLGRPGDVAVMDCSGSRSGAVMGALSARWAVKAGIAGCVVDGAIRDSASILDTGSTGVECHPPPRRRPLPLRDSCS